MEFESMSYWLFADSLPENGTMMQFVELSRYKNGQVLIFLGKIGDRIGEWKIFPSKISNLPAIVKALGKDEKTWAAKRFTIRPTDDKKLVDLTLLD